MWIVTLDGDAVSSDPDPKNPEALEGFIATRPRTSWPPLCWALFRGNQAPASVRRLKTGFYTTFRAGAIQPEDLEAI